MTSEHAADLRAIIDLLTEILQEVKALRGELDALPLQIATEMAQQVGK